MNNYIYRVACVLLLLSLALSGCRSIANNFVPATQDPEGLRITQQITVSRDAVGMDLLGVLEVSPLQTSLVVLNPTGLLLFSLSEGADHLTVEKHPDLPPFIDPIRILEDVKLVNWPVSQLRNTTASGITLTESPAERVLARDDDVHKRVRFEPASAQWQSATLLDYQHRYEIKVTKLHTESLSNH